MKDIIMRFSVIEDSRHSGYVVHKLEHILTIVMCAVLCGLDKLDEIMTYQENNHENLRKDFGIEKFPSKSTFSRVLSMVDGKAVGEVILQAMRDKIVSRGSVIAVDGKAIRSTGEKDKPHSALQIISAYLTENGVTLGQESIHEKTNEIPIFQQMLDYLDVQGKVITADAMHCQRETCRKIIEKKGDYVLGLKNNQPNFYSDVSLYFSDAELSKGMKCYETLEKNKNRLERRVCRKLTDLSWLNCRDSWCGLRCVFSIERTVETENKRTQETSYYISSLDESEDRLMDIVREHWKVEYMHWMLDVTFSEDSCRFISENAQKSLNSMRKCALAVHKNFLYNTHKKSSVKSSMLSALINHSYFCKLLEIS